MFTRNSNREKTGLEKSIDRLHDDMAGENPETEKYATMADNLTKLYKLREYDTRPRVSPDTLAIVTANLLGIAMIVGHERAHVVTSTAKNFVMKLK